MEIALVVLSILCLSFMIAYIDIVKKLNSVSDEFMKLLNIYDAMSNNIEVQNNINTLSNDIDIHKENFIKFLSDSRDWAFDYIEQVQSGLKKFIVETEKHIQHFDNYGDILSEHRPDYVAMKQISLSFKELKKLLPEEIDDRR